MYQEYATTVASVMMRPSSRADVGERPGVGMDLGSKRDYRRRAVHVGQVSDTGLIPVRHHCHIEVAEVSETARGRGAAPAGHRDNR
jgi:hypothetical protein